MMSADYFPGFEPPVLSPSISMDLEAAAPAVPFGGEADDFPISNRKTPGVCGLGFSSLKRRNPATSDLKSEMATGVQFRPRLRMDADTPGEYSSSTKSDTSDFKSEHRLVTNDETPTGSSGVGSSDTVISNDAVPGKPVVGVYADSHRPRGLGRHGDSHNGAASSDALLSGKGVGSNDTLGSTEGAPVLRTDAEYSSCAKNTPRQPGGLSADDQRGSIEPNPSLWNSFRFRVEQFARSLAPSRRRAIARRPRFRNQPYLRLADEPDADSLP
jgi:hypothetical protein